MEIQRLQSCEEKSFSVKVNGHCGCSFLGFTDNVSLLIPSAEM